MNITGTHVNKEIMILGVKIEGKEKIGNRIKKEIQKNGLKKLTDNMEGKNSLRWYKENENRQKKYINEGSWESALFKARTDSLGVNKKKRKKSGEMINVKNVYKVK